MKESLPISCKWLFTILVFNVEETEDQSDSNTLTERISLEIEKEFVLKSISEANYNTDEIKVVIAETKLMRKSGCKSILETTFISKNKDTKLLKDFIPKMQSTSEMLDKESLIKILKAIRTNFLGTNNIVLTLGHGATFGINYTDERILVAILDEVSKPNSVYTEWFGTILKNLNIQSFQPQQYFPRTSFTSGFYLLSTKEIADAFKAVYPQKTSGKRIDIMLMSNCFMQNIFTQYDLHGVVDYFIAPISGISYPGFNIKAILQNLLTHSSVKKVSKFCTDGATIRSNEAYNEPFSKKAIEQRWFIQNIKLNSEIYNDLKSYFEEFLNELVVLLSNAKYRSIIFNYIKTLERDNYKYSKKSLRSLNILDFGVFCKIFLQSLNDFNRNQIPDSKLKIILQEIIACLDKIEITHFIGDNFLEEEKNFNDYKIKNGISKIGFGFYFPTDFDSKSQLSAVLTNTNEYLPDIIKETKFLDLIKIIKG